MLSKGILATCIILLIAPVIAAQQSGDGLSVVSRPDGAEVVLIGEKTVSGVTPVNFRQMLEGRYKIDIRKDGYETYKSSLFMQVGLPRSISVDLKPKTRFKAFARSLFIPGWGQRYTDRKTKGSVFLMLTIGAVAAYFIADDNYDDKAGTYDDYLDRYNGMTSYTEKEQFYPELAEARNDAYDAETARRVTIGAVVAVWSLNLLDALFLFPDYGGPNSSLTVVPDFEQGGGKIILSHRF